MQAEPNMIPNNPESRLIALEQQATTSGHGWKVALWSMGVAQTLALALLALVLSRIDTLEARWLASIHEINNNRATVAERLGRLEAIIIHRSEFGK